MQLGSGSARGRRLIAAALFALALALDGCSVSTPDPIAPSTPPYLNECEPGARPLRHEFPSGNTWSLCWGIDDQAGLTLADVTFGRPDGVNVRILEQASLAQIQVPYDDGSESALDLPTFADLTATLGSGECPGGDVDHANGASICTAQVEDSPRFAWSDYDHGSGNHFGRGFCFRIFTVTPVQWYTYLNQWDFCDDGTIRPTVGAGGLLAPEYFGDESTGASLGRDDRYHLSHFHNVFWRLVFDLNSEIGPLVSEIRPENRDGRIISSPARIATEKAVDSAPNLFWRVTSDRAVNTDGKRLSYDIDAFNTSRYDGPFSSQIPARDMYVTQHDPCQMLAAGNQPSTCGAGIDEYVNDEALSKPTIWVKIGFHHIPREEDQPVMNEHWQGFSLVPRSLSDHNDLYREPLP